LAPAAVLDGTMLGKQKVDELLETIEKVMEMQLDDLNELASEVRASHQSCDALRPRLHGGQLPVLGRGAGARAAERATAGRDDVQVKSVGCMGLCSAGPLVEGVERRRPAGAVPARRRRMRRDRRQHGREPVERLRCPTSMSVFPRQQKIVLENSGVIDPEDINDYIAADGYVALVTRLTEMSPAEVLNEIRSAAAGPRRRRLSDGLKWSTVAKMPADSEIRHLQRRRGRSRRVHGPGGAGVGPASRAGGDGHRRLCGRRQPRVHLRAGRVSAGHRAAEDGDPAGDAQGGLLGTNICETQFSFEIESGWAPERLCAARRRPDGSRSRASGASRARVRRIPAEPGLWGYPTLINNVETLCQRRRRSSAAAANGSRDRHRASKGTKVFAWPAASATPA
jgi:bidirectional [NiFe] hydrogenase diaphorase subunit